MQHILPQEALVLLSENNAVLVDVREPEEYAMEHIAYAISLPMSEREKWMPWLLSQTARTWVMQCLTDGRAKKIAEELEAMSSESVHKVMVLEGGLTSWLTAGFETIKNSAPNKAVCCLSYKDPIQRFINILVGLTIFLIVHFVSSTFATYLLYLLSIGLILNGVLGRCLLSQYLSCYQTLCKSKKKMCNTGNSCNNNDNKCKSVK